MSHWRRLTPCAGGTLFHLLAMSKSWLDQHQIGLVGWTSAYVFGQRLLLIFVSVHCFTLQYVIIHTLGIQACSCHAITDERQPTSQATQELQNSFELDVYFQIAWKDCLYAAAELSNWTGLDADTSVGVHEISQHWDGASQGSTTCFSGAWSRTVRTSVGIDLTELGDQMSKCLKFCPGIEI